MDIKESNALIAEFMGVRIGDYSSFPEEAPTQFHINDLEYYSSWDWLMSVVEKIESLDIVVFVAMRSNYCGIAISESPMQITKQIESNKVVTEPRRIYTKQKDSKLKAVYNVVVRFIKWYNQNKKDEDN